MHCENGESKLKVHARLDSLSDRWAADVRRPIKAESLSALLQIYFDHLADPLPVVEKYVTVYFTELLESKDASADPDSDDEDDAGPADGKKNRKVVVLMCVSSAI
jgi:hypothetical protein